TMVAVLALALLQSPAARQSSVAPPIATFRGDPTHAGRYPAPTPEAYAGVAWRVETGGTVVSSPAVTASAVFLGSNDHHLYALDRTSGRVLWTLDAKGGITSSPTVSGSLVAFTTARGELIAADASNGRIRWRLATGPTLPFPWGNESGDIWTSSPTYA